MKSCFWKEKKKPSVISSMWVWDKLFQQAHVRKDWLTGNHNSEGGAHKVPSPTQESGLEQDSGSRQHSGFAARLWYPMWPWPVCNSLSVISRLVHCSIRLGYKGFSWHAPTTGSLRPLLCLREVGKSRLYSEYVCKFDLLAISCWKALFLGCVPRGSTMSEPKEKFTSSAESEP